MSMNKIFDWVQHIGKWRVLISGRDLNEQTITSRELADGCVTREKLADDIIPDILSAINRLTMGFFTDGEDPSPILLIAGRPGYINETVVPYLLLGQEDYSDHAIRWQWKRNSRRPDFDNVWNQSEKAGARTLNLTDADLPSGWWFDGGRVAFTCTVYFMSGGEEKKIYNTITIL